MHSFKKVFIFLFALNLSWFLPPFSWGWNLIDQTLFSTFNSLILQSPSFQSFWIVASGRITDQASEIFMFFGGVLYVYSGKEEEIPIRWKRVGFLVLCVFSSFLIGKFLIAPLVKFFHVKRASPTLMNPEAFRLSTQALVTGVKDYSKQSFPGDHAIVLMTWALVLAHYWGRQGYLLIGAVTFFFSLPRLFAGAHWPTDILIGSLTISLITTFLALRSSLYQKIEHP